MKFDKLIRDNIPEIIKKQNKVALVYRANDKEFHLRLREKLREEVNEFLEDEGIEELADILEVLYTFCDLLEIDKKELERIRKNKVKEKGAFKDKIVLKEVHNE